MIALLYAAAFLSGVAALVFETLWFRSASLAVGNTVWASTLVLSSFMGGLALGSAAVGHWRQRIRRPLLAYGLLELLVGAAGLLLVRQFPSITVWLQPVFQPFLDRPVILHSLRFLAGFALLVIPATAMGATLPLIVAGAGSFGTSFGSSLGGSTAGTPWVPCAARRSSRRGSSGRSACAEALSSPPVAKPWCAPSRCSRAASRR